MTEKVDRVDIPNAGRIEVRFLSGAVWTYDDATYAFESWSDFLRVEYKSGYSLIRTSVISSIDVKRTEAK